METNDEHQSMDITIFVPSLLWYRVRKGKKKENIYIFLSTLPEIFLLKVEKILEFLIDEKYWKIFFVW